MKDQRLSAAAALIQISGHPLQTFTLENAALEKLIARARQALEIMELPMNCLTSCARLLSTMPEKETYFIHI